MAIIAIGPQPPAAAADSRSMVTDTLLVLLWMAALRMPRGEVLDLDWEDLGAYTERCLEAWPPAARA